MSAKIYHLYPVEQELSEEEREYLERIALSSEVRLIPREDYKKVWDEHKEAVIRKAVLERMWL